MHLVIEEAKESEGQDKMGSTKLTFQELGATSQAGPGVAVGDGWDHSQAGDGGHSFDPEKVTQSCR